MGDQYAWESLRTRPLPAWYDDAKLGVFLHWGLYSVPGWAPRVTDIQTLLRRRGPRYLLAHSPYAEWYANTLRLPDSPTERHHAEVYGAAFPYDGFREEFDEASAHADLDALADTCRRAGARYVVLTTKHHDGFCLWPSAQPHPAKGAYHARRDLVGDLTEAVRAAGMRMGLYYSGGFDWPFNDAVIARSADMLLGVPQTPEYATYATAHIDELIDRYRPSVLWNDIAFPTGADLPALFARYYDAVPDGVVNDRWMQAPRPAGPALTAVVRAAGAGVEALWPLLPAAAKRIPDSRVPHCDFRTTEYTHPETASQDKWEACRGVGHSFGANRNERASDIIGTAELVRTFVDIVAKNGNLLIGVGPAADGVVPEIQTEPLLGLGEWLAANGEAMFDTRPWQPAAGETSDGSPLRYTVRGDTLYASMLETPPSRTVCLPEVDAATVADVCLLGIDGSLEWVPDGPRLSVRLPERLPVSPVHVLRIRSWTHAISGRIPGIASNEAT